MENFFEVHSSERGVAVKKPFRVRNFDLQTLNSFQSDAQAAEAGEVQVYSEYIVCMPVHISPVIALLSHDPKNVWKPRFSNSVRTLYDLNMIRECFWNNPYLDHYKNDKKRVLGIMDAFAAAKKARRAQFFDDVAKLQQQQLQKFERVDRFVRLLEQHTVNQIQLAEDVLIKLFKLRDVPLTPSEPLYSAEVIIGKGREGFYETLRRMLDAKQVLLNTSLEKGGHETQTWFNLEALPQRMQETDQLYKGYIHSETVWEYYQLMGDLQ